MKTANERKTSYQPREQASGQFAFVNNWGRKCVCGHELGVHTAEAPHECMNNDRRHIGCEGDDWMDKSIAPTSCACVKFRPSRRKS